MKIGKGRGRLVIPIYKYSMGRKRARMAFIGSKVLVEIF